MRAAAWIWPSTVRAWRKLHIAVDPDSGQALAEELTRSDVHDTVLVAGMLGRIAGPLRRVYGDGAYAGGQHIGRSPSAVRRCPTPRACSGPKRPTFAPRPGSTR